MCLSLTLKSVKNYLTGDSIYLYVLQDNQIMVFRNLLLNRFLIIFFKLTILWAEISKYIYDFYRCFFDFI